MKATVKVTASLVLNTEKAGGWLATFKRTTPTPNGVGGFDEQVFTDVTAWKNASAGKRWIKSMVQEHTPRKSIKLEVLGVIPETEKPSTLRGEFTYKE